MAVMWAQVHKPFTTLETRRKLGLLLETGKTNWLIARPQGWFSLAKESESESES